jgi:hypothetical protein
MPEEGEGDNGGPQQQTTPGTQTQDHAPDMPPTPVPDTRRTSMSSTGRDGSMSMQASQTSIVSEAARRQRPRPLDYGMLPIAPTQV